MIGLTTLVGCAAPSPAHQLETVSLLGGSLYRPTMTVDKFVRLEKDLAIARERAAAHPQSEEDAIWVGRRLGYLGRYRETIDWYGDCIAKFGPTPKLLRHRGHRYITLRWLAPAIADLSRAQKLVESMSDEIEPDGIPTPAGPRTTLQGNIDYHLALALFLHGEWTGNRPGDLDAASAAWRRAVERANNDDSVVAARYWLAITEFEGGDPTAAKAALDPVKPVMDILDNTTYHQLCLALKGTIPAEALSAKDGPLGLGVDRATLGFGLAMHARHVAHDERLAHSRLLETSQLPEWAAFGVIASEAVLCSERARR